VGTPAPTTDEQVLELLVERGPMTVDQLAGVLRLGQVSVRGSVERLQLRGAARVSVARAGLPDVWEATPGG
jgi:predicted ArsR family transcriptional regulator